MTEAPFDREEAARRLGVTVSWLRDHRHEVPHRRIGRFLRYTQADLDRYLERAAVDPDPYAASERSRTVRRTA